MDFSNVKMVNYKNNIYSIGDLTIEQVFTTLDIKPENMDMYVEGDTLSIFAKTGSKGAVKVIDLSSLVAPKEEPAKPQRVTVMFSDGKLVALGSKVTFDGTGLQTVKAEEPIQLKTDEQKAQEGADFIDNLVAEAEKTEVNGETAEMVELLKGALTYSFAAGKITVPQLSRAVAFLTNLK